MPSFDADYRALTDGAGFVDVSDRSQLELTGEDRAKFLHNFTTNDILALTPGHGCESFLLESKGHVIGHPLVFCTPHSLVIDAVPGQGETLRSHLDRYLIRERVEIHDRSEAWGELLVAGAEAAPLLHGLIGELPEGALDHRQADLFWQTVWLRRVDIAGPGSFLIAGAAEAIDAVSIGLEAEGIARCGAEALDAVRIEAGFPLFGRDISDKNLPQEVDRNARAISFKKGCYLGQETVARIDALGHVNKRLACLRVDGASPPQPGTTILAGEQPVGELTSAAFSPLLQSAIALGYVRRGSDTLGAKLHLGSTDAEIIAPPRSAGV